MGTLRSWEDYGDLPWEEMRTEHDVGAKEEEEKKKGDVGGRKEEDAGSVGTLRSWGDYCDISWDELRPEHSGGGGTSHIAVGAAAGEERRGERMAEGKWEIDEGRWLTAHPNARYGLLRGVLESRSSRRTAIVKVVGPPLWLPVAEALGLAVVGVRAVRTDWQYFLRRVQPAARILSENQFASTKAEVALFDWEAAPRQGSFWERAEIQLVLIAGTARTPKGKMTTFDCPAGWHIQHLPLWHPGIGGASTFKAIVWVLSRAKIGTLGPVPALPPQPLIATVSDTETGLAVPKLPPARKVRTGSVLWVENQHGQYGRRGWRMISAYGWMPSERPMVQVVVPSVRVGPNRMVRRALRPGELGKVWDFPTMWADHLAGAAGQLLAEQATKTPPARVLQESLKLALMFWNGGGGSSKPSSTALLADAKMKGQEKKRSGADLEGYRKKKKRRKRRNDIMVSSTQPSFPSPTTTTTTTTSLPSTTTRPTLSLPSTTTSPTLPMSPTSLSQTTSPPSPTTNLTLPTSPTTSSTTTPMLLEPPSALEGWQRYVQEREGDIGRLGIAQRAAGVSQLGVKRDVIKADDADVPVHLWNDHFWKRGGGGSVIPLAWTWALDLLRLAAISWWRRNLRRELWRHLRSFSRGEPQDTTRMVQVVREEGRQRYRWREGGLSAYKEWHRRCRQSPDFEAGRECVRRGARSSFWNWEDGSRLIFWRWPKRWRKLIRDGQPHRLMGTLPRFTRAQSAPKNQRVVPEKLLKLRRRQYIEVGHVTSLTHFFDVPKGEEDVRMVFNGTSSGLNRVLYAPRFTLPTVEHLLRALAVGTNLCDFDIAEMFYNFMLHPLIRAFCGVDISLVRSQDTSFESQRPNRWERFCRNMMGLTDSPYRSVQPLMWAKELIMGDGKGNGPYRWDRVELNLPGSAGYDPRRPWVAKVRVDGSLASDLFIYMDDGRVTAGSEEECWAAARHAAARLNFLGIQDAARKRSYPSTKPGPWAGTMVICDGQVSGTTTTKKWNKAQGIVSELAASLAKDRGQLSLKRIEKDTGFLVYLGRTFRHMVPYLKGLYLTADSWRPDRDMGGWKYSRRELAAAVAEGKVPEEDYPEAPLTVQAVPRLASDLEALGSFLGGPAPPVQPYRAEKKSVFFLFGDASGVAMGAACCRDGVVTWTSGEWEEEAKLQSSNWREATNLADRFEEEAEAGDLKGTEVFILTDNFVFESTYWKGSSSSRKLHEIVLRLHRTAHFKGVLLRVYHISGERMKRSGVDGLSRGDLLEGIMAGADPLSFVPFHLGADQRANGLVSAWVMSWWGNSALEVLNEDGWFRKAHEDADCLWMPPPAAAHIALEQFEEAKHKRPQVAHVFVIPRLMTGHWRKALSRGTDLLCTVPAGLSFWNEEQCEPLMLAISLPSFQRSDRPNDWTGPWLVRGSVFAEDAQRSLQEAFARDDRSRKAGPLELDGHLRQTGVQSAPEERCGRILQQFLGTARSLPSMPEVLVRKLLQRAARPNLPRQN